MKTLREEIEEIISEIGPGVDAIKDWVERPGNLDPFGIAAIVANHVTDFHAKYAQRLQSALDRTKGEGGGE